MQCSYNLCYSEWLHRDCEGVDLIYNGFIAESEAICKNKCDELPQCTHAVYGGYGGMTGTPSDWWTKRCVPRKDFKGICPLSNWMKTYVKGE